MQGFRKDKLSYFPLALILPVAAIAVIVATSGGPSVAESKSLSFAEQSAIRRTEKLLAGLPQHGALLGEPKAPVTLQFFGDLQCKESRQVMLGALPFLIRHWVREGKLRILFRSAKADTPEWPEFRNQQIAALAAGGQGGMWTFVDLFYREQQPEYSHYADDAFLEGIARQAALDLRAWGAERASDRWAIKIESDEVMGKSKGLESTPSFLIGLTGRRARVLRHFSLNEPKVFDEAIRELLRQA
jgi:protein-disulfide isomerase